MLPLLAAQISVELDDLDSAGKALELVRSSSPLEDWLVPIVAIVMTFGLPLFIVMVVLYYRSKRQRMVNELVMKLADKGQPIPPELFFDQGAQRKSQLSSALGLIGAGIGLMGFFLIVGAPEAVGIGFIPLAIGVGQLIAWKIEQGKKET